jgi:hypothetical protein
LDGKFSNLEDVSIMEELEDALSALCRMNGKIWMVNLAT